MKSFARFLAGFLLGSAVLSVASAQLGTSKLIWPSATRKYSTFGIVRVSDDANLILIQGGRVYEYELIDRSAGTQELAADDPLAEVVDMTPDGRYVLYYSLYWTFHVGHPQGTFQLYRYDRVRKSTLAVSQNILNGTFGNGNTFKGRMSADGQIIAFSSSSSNLVAGDTDGKDVFLLDLRKNELSRLMGIGGLSPNAPVEVADITSSGRFVLMNSQATNLVAGLSNPFGDAFLWDRETNQLSVVSLDNGGTPIFSANEGLRVTESGRHILFGSKRETTVENVYDAKLCVYDRVTANTETLYTTKKGRSVWNQPDYTADISDDGRFVAFCYWYGWDSGVSFPSRRGTLVRDRLNRNTTLISRDENGDPVRSDSFAMSRDGSWFTYPSECNLYLAEYGFGPPFSISTPATSFVEGDKVPVQIRFAQPLKKATRVYLRNDEANSPEMEMQRYVEFAAGEQSKTGYATIPPLSYGERKFRVFAFSEGVDRASTPILGTTQFESIKTKGTAFPPFTRVTATVTIKRSAPAGGVRFRPWVHNQGAVWPKEVVIPEGQKQVDFQFTTGELPHPRYYYWSFWLTVGYETSSYGTRFNVRPWVTGVVLPSSGRSGQFIEGRVNLLQPAPTNGLRVTLSTNSRAIAVPTALNIPAGAKSFEFLAQLNTVTAPTDVKVFASFGGYTAGTTVRVNP